MSAVPIHPRVLILARVPARSASQLFARRLKVDGVVPRSNYDTFHNAMLSVFQVMAERDPHALTLDTI